MPISCKPILINSTPCNCVTAVTSSGDYGVASPLYPTTASLNALHTVQYNDRVVMYKKTSTGWIEVQNYTLGGSDTDTRIEFNQVLPSGEWEWNIRDIVANTILSTFTTPATGAQTITSIDSSVVVVGSDLSVTHTLNPDGSITLNDGTVIPAPTTVAPETITTLINNNNGTATYINEAGTPITFPIGSATLVNNSDGTYTFTAADGATVTITDTSLSTLVDNGNNSFTYTNEAGLATTFTVAADILTTITNTIAGNKIADYTDELGIVIPINETVTSIVNNSDGTATYTDESGTSITFPIGGATLVDNGNGTITYTSESGTVTTFDEGFTSFVNSANGFTATYPNGSTYVWSETITALVAATDGFSYTSENGTVTTVTYLFDNATPASPNLLVQVNGTTQASIPLNSYDVNISTSGGFTFNPTTDEITITETDGETHIIDLTPLRTTLTSVDNSVQVVSSVNPDGSTNYDLGVKAHTNQIESVVYTGTELPSIAGVNIGDTTDAQFLNGTVVSYTWDGTTWVQDFEQTWGEQRICLNTVAPAFTPADVNNPTTAEVEAWTTANLTIQQRENGTQLVYFVAGDGGSCDNPDYIYTLNKGSQLVTLTNKRVFNTKTVYVDAGSGSDITGRRGYKEFPFKTLDTAIGVVQDMDLLYVLPGDYTSNVSTTKAFNIYCENGVTWTYTVRLATTLTTPQKLDWTFDTLKSNLTNNKTLFFISGTNFELDLKVNYLLNALIQTANAVSNAITKVNALIGTSENSYVHLSTINTTSNPSCSNMTINNVIRENYSYRNFFMSGGLNTVQTINVDNVVYKGINAEQVLISADASAADAGLDKIYNINIKNIRAVNTDIITIPSIYSPFSDWHANTIDSNNGQIGRVIFRNSKRVYSVTIDNIESYRNGFGIGSVGTSDNYTFIINMKGRFRKGVPIFTGALNTPTNCKLILNLDLIVDDATGVYLGANATGNPGNNITASNRIYITGRIQTLRTGFPCITIQGLTNGTINLKDLTLINDGTVSPIMTSNVVPENIQIQNVVSNSLISDPNIIETGQSIIRNTNYK